jgi:hypothetical protein
VDAVYCVEVFWSPLTLLPALKDFRRVSRFFQFTSYGEYRRAKERSENDRTGMAEKCQKLYFGLASKLGKYSLFVLPNMASTFRRRDTEARTFN